MNIKTIAHRSLGLLLLLILLAVYGVAPKVVPTEAGVVSAVVSLTLLAVACVAAGYFLRTFWALLIVPVAFLGSAYLFGIFTMSMRPDIFFFAVIFAINVMIIIIIALLALLGVLLGKRSARTAAALVAS
jgi:hypothetical protein